MPVVLNLQMLATQKENETKLGASYCSTGANAINISGLLV